MQDHTDLTDWRILLAKGLYTAGVELYIHFLIYVYRTEHDITAGSTGTGEQTATIKYGPLNSDRFQNNKVSIVYWGLPT